MQLQRTAAGEGARQEIIILEMELEISVAKGTRLVG